MARTLTPTTSCSGTTTSCSTKSSRLRRRAGVYPGPVPDPAGGNVARAVSEPNPYYWKVDTEGNQLPYIQRIEWEFLSDPELLLLRTLNGEVEFMNYYANSLKNKAVLYDNMEQGDYHFF